MELPNPDLVVDTFIPIKDLNFDAYISQLRSDVIPEIRKMQSENKIVWYSFLIHDHKTLSGRVPTTDKNHYIHIRLGLPEGADINQFINQLPSHFQQPIQNPLTPLHGIEPSALNDNNWIYAWKVHGEASEWVLKMVESHGHNASIPIQHMIQFMHYITNPLMIGHKCLFIPQGFMSF